MVTMFMSALDIVSEMRPTEIEHYGIYPVEEITSRLVLPYFLYDTVECTENKLLRLMFIGTKKYGSGKKPVSILGNKLFRPVFSVFPYFLPDFHNS